MSFGTSSGPRPLSASSDVALSNIEDKQVLKYNQYIGKWQNSPASGVRIKVYDDTASSYLDTSSVPLYVGSVDPQTLGVSGGAWIQGTVVGS